MKISHMIQAVDLLYKEWDLGKTPSKSKGKICAWIYLMDILESAEVIIIHEERHKLIGFCGYTKFKSTKYKFRKKFYHIIKQCLFMSHLIGDIEALRKYNENYYYVPKELENYFDGEITILMVDKEYRGKGIGKKLLQEVFEYAKKDKIKRLQILTDESCNFKFYDTCGCNKIYEKVILNEEPDKCKSVSTEIGYIYEKVLM